MSDNPVVRSIIAPLVVSLIVGGVSVFGTVTVLSSDINWIKDAVLEIKGDFGDLRERVRNIEIENARRNK